MEELAMECRAEHAFVLELGMVRRTQWAKTDGLAEASYMSGTFALADLTRDRRVGDFCVFGEHEGFAEDDRQHAVAFEGEEEFAGAARGRALAGNDAEITVVG